MEQLGNDELFCIVKRIENKHDLLSFSQVSKQFLKVACVRRSSLKNSFTDMLHDVLPASPNLRSFRCCKPLANKHMKLLAQSCPKLTCLDLRIKKKLDLEADSEPTKFDLDDDGLSIVGSACMHLDDVNLKGRSRVGDVEVGSLVRLFKNLKFLSLKRCVNVTDESLKTLGQANCLKCLTLDGCFLITDLGLEFLANGNVKNCLRLLSLSKCNRISDDGIHHLKQMHGLEHLDLSKCGVNVTDSGVVAISQLPKIRSLQLSWLINVTDISLLHIARNCIKLNAIYLAGCKAISSRGLRAFAYHQTLESLDLSSCPNISWNEVERVAPTWMMIENLELSKSIKTQMPEGAETKYYFCCTIVWKD